MRLLEYPQYDGPPPGYFELNRASPQARGVVWWGPTQGSRGTNVLRDMSGLGNHGTFPGGADDPVWIATDQGYALDFDGTDYVEVVDSGILQIAGNFSIGMWVRRDAAGDHGLFDNDPLLSDGGTQARFDAITHLLRWRTDDDGVNFVVLVSATAVNDTAWHHLAFVMDKGSATGAKIYIDGVQDTNTEDPTGLGDTSGQENLRIAMFNAEGFEGAIRELRIASVAWAPSEVSHQVAYPWHLHRTPMPMWASVLGGTTYFQSIAGVFTPSGVLVKEAHKPLAGVLTPSGIVTKEAQKPLAGILTPSGIVTKETQKPLGGAWSGSGSLARKALKVLAGTLTSSGALAKKTLKAFVGVWSGSGALTKAAAKPLAGDLTPTGALTKKTLKQLAGSWSGSGVLGATRLFYLALAGALGFSGALTKKTRKPLAGEQTFVGSIAKKTLKGLAGVISWIGSLVGLPVGPVEAIPLTLRPRSFALTLSPQSFSLTLGEKP